MKGRKFEFYNAEFEWKLQDFWVGGYWKQTGSTVDLWICLLPCIPLHLSWGFKSSDQ